MERYLKCEICKILHGGILVFIDSDGMCVFGAGCGESGAVKEQLLQDWYRMRRALELPCLIEMEG